MPLNEENMALKDDLKDSIAIWRKPNGNPMSIRWHIITLAFMAVLYLVELGTGYLQYRMPFIGQQGMAFAVGALAATLSYRLRFAKN